MKSVKLLYIELLKKCVSHWLWISDEQKETRINGRDWPEPYKGETMIGIKRLDNIIKCAIDVINNKVPGDFIETGVWRGGAVILMKGILNAFEISDRNVWVADSFKGVPIPNPDEFPLDRGDRLYQFEQLSVSKEKVIKNFEKYGLLDSKVKFLEGWFKDTLYNSGIDKLALLRLDGDLYESTFQSLDALYPKLSVGGYCIIDDFGTFDHCRQAVLDFRRENNINDSIEDIDGWGIYWKKTEA